MDRNRKGNLIQQVIHTSVIHASQERVFALLTDYENWPTTFPAAKAVRIVKREGNTVEAIVERRIWPHRVMLHDRLLPPGRIERIDRASGDECKATFTLEPIPEGTRLTISAE